MICIASHFGANLCCRGLSAAGMVTAGSERSTTPSILSSTILWIEMRKTSSFLGDDNICINYTRILNYDNILYARAY